MNLPHTRFHWTWMSIFEQATRIGDRVSSSPAKSVEANPKGELDDSRDHHVHLGQRVVSRLDAAYFYHRVAMCRALAASIDGIMEPKMRLALLALADKYEVTADELGAVNQGEVNQEVLTARGS